MKEHDKFLVVEIANRPKQGFSIPIHEWIRGPLKDTIRDLLSPASLSQLNLFEIPAVQRIIKDHFSGERSYGFELWGLAVLVAWHRARIQHPPQKPKRADLIQRVYPCEIKFADCKEEMQINKPFLHL